MLIAAIRSGDALAGKAVSYSEDDGKFWLTGVGQIEPAKLLEYDAAGLLEWADDATRSWVIGLVQGTAGPAPLPTAPSVSDASAPAVPAVADVGPGAGDDLEPDDGPVVPAASSEPVAAPSAEDPPAGTPPAGGPATQADAPIAVTAAQSLRRGAVQRPEFVESKRRGWRPSELQQKTLLYLAVGIVMVAIVVVLAVWGAGRGGDGDETLEGSGWTVAIQVDGAGDLRSDEFELGSGQHKVEYSVEFIGLTTGTYDICVVPLDAPAGTERDYSVARGSLSASASEVSETVPLPSGSGSFVIQVFASDCGWSVKVLDDR